MFAPCIKSDENSFIFQRMAASKLMYIRFLVVVLDKYWTAP
jgi:hypothetical protein